MSDEPPAKRGKRLKPCQRCKTQRRKCERNSTNETCSRCIKSNRECINDDGSQDNNDDTIDGTPEVEYLTKQIADLQQSLQQMELYLQNKQLETSTDLHNIRNSFDMITNNNYNSNDSYNNTNNYINNSNNNSIDDNNDDHSTISIYSSPHSQEYHLIKGNYQMPLSPFSPIPTANSMSSPNLSIITDEDDNNNNNNNNNNENNENNENYNWELTLVDGELRLKTPIYSVEELLAYGNAVHRYLSPFSGAFNNTFFIFEYNQPESLVCVAIDVVSRADLRKQQRKKLLGSSITLHPSYHKLFDNNGRPYISVIEELIEAYFNCVNPGFPLLHEPTYRANYDRDVRPDPYRHGITLALCTMMCACSCKHFKYDNFEKRILADYFYQQANDILFDIFDDPDKKLETVIIINLLAGYYRYALRLSEARKWCSISYMLCKDLEVEYQLPNFGSLKHSSSASSFSGSPPASPASSASTISTLSSTSIKIASTPSNINRALFGRHYMASILQQKFLNFIVDHDLDTFEYLSVCPLEFLDDEGEVESAFLEIYNCFLELLTHPVLLEWTEQTQKMLIGRSAKISLELILKFDQAYKQWWYSVPDHLRLCDKDPDDIKCRDYISECENEYKLLLFAIMIGHRAEAFIALVRPSNQSSVMNDGSYALLCAIQDKALTNAFECCETMVLAVKKLELLKEYCLFTSDFLISLADLLSSLVESFNEAISLKARQKLNETINELQHTFFMKGSLVPVSASPLNYFNNLKNSTTNDKSINLLEMYDSYASPILAFSYDILRNAANTNKRNNHLNQKFY